MGIYRNETASRVISYGDRIFVRLTMSRATVVELTLENVSDYTDVIGELRFHTRGVHGLCHLYVRNMTRGWSHERPIKLYGDNLPSPKNSPFSTSRLKVSQQSPAAVPAEHAHHTVPESVIQLFGLH